MSSEREVMSWEQLGIGSRELAEAIYADDWVPDLILGISRGGLLVAGALAYALGVKNTATISVEFYTGIDERLELPMLLPPVPDLVDLSAARVLIADDVADTGATLELVHDFCAGRVAETRIAVLYEKSRTTINCEYVWRRTDDWITFPWSALPAGDRRRRPSNADARAQRSGRSRAGSIPSHCRASRCIVPSARIRARARSTSETAIGPPRVTATT